MTPLYVNSTVEDGCVEFLFGNNVNCQIGLVSIAMPETADENDKITVSCDQVDATAQNPGRIIRQFFHEKNAKNYEFPQILFHTIDTTDRKLQIRFWDTVGHPLEFKELAPRILLTFVLKCDTTKKWLKR